MFKAQTRQPGQNNTSSLNGIDKKERILFFNVPIEVGSSLVSLPDLVADGLLVDALLDSNWMIAVGAWLDVGCLELVLGLEKLKLKKLPDPRNEFIGSRFKIYASIMVEIAPGSSTMCGVVHCPMPHDELCFVVSKVDWDFCITSLKIKTEKKLLTPSAFNIRLNYLLI